MSLDGLDHVPPPVKDAEESWRGVRLVSYVVPVVTLFVLALGLILRPETRQWADVQLSVAVLAVFGLAAVLLGPVFVRATMISALDAFAKRRPPAAEGTVASAIAPLLIAQVVACGLPGLLGLIAYLMGAPAIVFFGFVAVSFLSYAYFFPRRPQWFGWLARARPIDPSPPPMLHGHPRV